MQFAINRTVGGGTRSGVPMLTAVLLLVYACLQRFTAIDKDGGDTPSSVTTLSADLSHNGSGPSATHTPGKLSDKIN